MQRVYLAVFLLVPLAGCAALRSSSDSATSAAAACQLDQVDVLLAEGRLDPNREGDFGMTPLAAAVSSSRPAGSGCPEVLLRLIEEGADVTRPDGGTGLVVWAARHNQDPLVVDVLMSHGSDPCGPISDEMSSALDAVTTRDVAEYNDSLEMREKIEEVTSDC